MLMQYNNFGIISLFIVICDLLLGPHNILAKACYVRLKLPFQLLPAVFLLGPRFHPFIPQSVCKLTGPELKLVTWEALLSLSSVCQCHHAVPDLLVSD